ncbi:unnamed protein product, partial [Brachionus calyciflorus]
MFEIERDEETQTQNDFLIEDFDSTDETTSVYAGRNSVLEHELFLAMIPRWKYDLGEHYKNLATNLYKWDEFFELCKFKLFDLKDYIHNSFFYEIINIHFQLVREGKLKGILPILIDLIHRKLHFLILYVYITNQVPKEFKKINYVFFGVTDKYPEAINR